jgi:hypothetical protein
VRARYLQWKERKKEVNKEVHLGALFSQLHLLRFLPCFYSAANSPNKDSGELTSPNKDSGEPTEHPKSHSFYYSAGC